MQLCHNYGHEAMLSSCILVGDPGGWLPDDRRRCSFGVRQGEHPRGNPSARSHLQRTKTPPYLPSGTRSFWTYPSATWQSLLQGNEGCKGGVVFASTDEKRRKWMATYNKKRDETLSVLSSQLKASWRATTAVSSKTRGHPKKEPPARAMAVSSWRESLDPCQIYLYII